MIDCVRNGRSDKRPQKRRVTTLELGVVKERTRPLSITKYGVVITFESIK